MRRINNDVGNRNAIRISDFAKLPLCCCRTIRVNIAGFASGRPRSSRPSRFSVHPRGGGGGGGIDASYSGLKIRVGTPTIAVENHTDLEYISIITDVLYNNNNNSLLTLCHESLCPSPALGENLSGSSLDDIVGVYSWRVYFRCGRREKNSTELSGRRPVPEALARGRHNRLTVCRVSESVTAERREQTNRTSVPSITRHTCSGGGVVVSVLFGLVPVSVGP